MSSSGATHTCRFGRDLEWGSWLEVGDGLREREARRVFRCVECGCDRPRRKPRPPGWVERERNGSVPVRGSGPDGAVVAGRLLREAFRAGSGAISGKRLFGLLRAQGLPGSAAQEWLEALLWAGLVRLRYRLRGTRRQIDRVEVLDRDALEELAQPGQRAARIEALGRARVAVSALDHPVARAVSDALEDDGAAALGPDLLRALAAVAAHAASGEVLAERVFAARALGDSKALRRLRRSIERVVGPLDAIGIREGAAVTLVGGSGRLAIRDAIVDLEALGPFVGLSREALSSRLRAELPADGMFVVENLTAFEACCRGEVPAARGSMIVWSAGYPGRGVRALVDLAASACTTVRVWADLDLDGIRIARMVARWAGSRFVPFRMAADDVRTALVVRPLSPAAMSAIRADLQANPDAPLAATLAALLERGAWIEQETFLATRAA